MSSGKRYDRNSKPKLNMKKVLGVIVAIAVVIMFGISITKLLSTEEENHFETTYYFAAYKNGKWGVINQVGNEILPLNQEEMVIVPNSSKDVFIVTTDVNYETESYTTKAKNAKGEQLYSEYEAVEAIDNFDASGNLWYEDGCLRVKKDGKYGLINIKGELLLGCKYDSIESLKGTDNSLIIAIDGKVGIASNVGDIIVKPEYSKVTALGDKYSDGYIVTNEDGKSGLIGYNKKTVLKESYEEIKQIPSDTFYAVKQEGQWKIVNENEEAVIEAEYSDFLQIKNEIIIAKKGKNVGAINTKNEEKIPFEYQELIYVLDKYYIAKKDNKYGVLDSEGKELLAFEYDMIQNRKGTDFIEAEKGTEETEVYNKEMKLAITGILSEVNTEDGYIILRKDGLWEFYNFKFEKKTEQDIFPEHTLLLSKKDGKYGYINKDGAVIVDYIYDEARLQNKYGYCSVKKGDKWGSINKDGNMSQETEVNLEEYLVIDFIGKWHYGKELEMNYYTF